MTNSLLIITVIECQDYSKSEKICQRIDNQNRVNLDSRWVPYTPPKS